MIEKLGRLYVSVHKGMTFATRNVFGGITNCSYDLIHAIAKAFKIVDYHISLHPLSKPYEVYG